METGYRVRFVGGPCHNELRALPLPLPSVTRVPIEVKGFVPDYVPVTDYGPVTGYVPVCKFEVETYFLCKFISEYGTFYCQYVHTSLFKDGQAMREAYREFFPEFTLATLASSRLIPA